MRKIKVHKDRNKVYVECDETTRRVKGLIIHKDNNHLNVEMPTGCVLKMEKRTVRGVYKTRIGLLEFFTDGREVS
jgi:hypothetical protein